MTLFVWLVMIFAVSVYPIQTPQGVERFADKIFHFIVYLITALLFYTYVVKSKNMAFRARAYLISFLLATAYGGLMEVAQGTLTSYRQPSILDAISNGLGALLGMAYLKVRHRRR